MAYLLDVDAAPSHPVDEPLAADGGRAPIALNARLLDELWLACDASAWGLDRGSFDRIILLVGIRQNFGLPSGINASSDQQIGFFRSVKLSDLVLAQACAEGSERAWEHFMAVYGSQLTRAAIAISQSETVGRDLADAFYAELYGLTTRDGQRKCPLESYRGRGSLIGWLRTTLSQRFVDHYRRTFREQELDEQKHDAEAPDSTPAPEGAVASTLAMSVQSALSEQPAEQRFVLAAYYLDGRTLAEIGKILRVHEATISRRLKRATDEVRKRLLRNLEKSGMSRRAAEEALGTDPRDVDLKMDLKKLLQYSAPSPFPEQERPQEIANTLPGILIPDNAAPISNALSNKTKAEE